MAESRNILFNSGEELGDKEYQKRLFRNQAAYRKALYLNQQQQEKWKQEHEKRLQELVITPAMAEKEKALKEKYKNYQPQSILPNSYKERQQWMMDYSQHMAQKQLKDRKERPELQRSMMERMEQRKLKDQQRLEEVQQKNRQRVERAGRVTNWRKNSNSSNKSIYSPSMQSPFDYENELQNKKWQKTWEELTGSNSMAPSRFYNQGNNFQPRGYKDPYLQEQALEYKRKQQALSRQRFQESFDEEKWRDQYRKNRTYTPSATTAQPSQYGSMSMGPNSSMQSPFQF